MPKKPKPDGSDGKDNWADDQKEREYYYDDAHGYEEYTPEAEDEPEDDTETGRRGDDRHLI